MSKQERPQEDLAEQWEKDKQANWEALKARLGLDDPIHPIPPRKHAFSPRRIVALCAASFVGVSVCVGAGFFVSSFFKDVTPTDPNRYCAQGDYEKYATEMTLQEYSLQNDAKICHFDPTTQNVTIVSTSTFNLKSTNEIVAFQEHIEYNDYGYDIILNVTDNHTEVYDFDNYKGTCIDFAHVNDIEINYSHDSLFFSNKSMWEYDGYRYYMSVQNIATEDELFDLITLLTESVS